MNWLKTNKVVFMSLFLLRASLLFSQATNVQVVPGSLKSGVFEVKKGAGKVPVESREFQVNIALPNNKNEMLYVSLLYDPHTKLFWWYTDSVAAASARQKLGAPMLIPYDSALCLTDSKFVLFWNGPFSGDNIFILDSSEHYSSFDEGQAHFLRMLQDPS